MWAADKSEGIWMMMGSQFPLLLISTTEATRHGLHLAFDTDPQFATRVVQAKTRVLYGANAFREKNSKYDISFKIMSKIVRMKSCSQWPAL